MPKENVPCKYLSTIILDSLIKAKKKYYPQTLLDECKYEPKKIKMENLLDDDLEKRLSDESDNDSNDEQNLIMMNLTNNLLKAKKYFNNNKNLIMYVIHALLGFYLRQYV